MGRRHAPARRAGRARYRPSRYTPADVEELERALYGVDSERESVAHELDAVRAQLAAVGGSRERGMKGKSARAQAVHVRGLVAAHRSVGKGYTARDSYGDDSEAGYAELLEQRAELVAHQHHLKAEHDDITEQWHKVRRAVAGARRVPVPARKRSAALRR